MLWSHVENGRVRRIAAGDDVRPCTATQVRGALPELLSSLLPLISAYANRTLLIPARAVDGRSWTTCVTNSWQGTESASIMLFGARASRAVAVTEAPNTYDHATNLGIWRPQP